MTTLQNKAIEAYNQKKYYERNKKNIDAANLFTEITGLVPDQVKNGVVVKDRLKFWMHPIPYRQQLKTSFLCTECHTEQEVDIACLADIGVLLVERFVCWKCIEDGENNDQ